MYGQIARGVVTLGQSLSSGLARAASTHSLRRAARASGTRVLAPGDTAPPPVGTVDYYDYRGVATARELRELGGHAFSLGRALDPRAGPRQEIGLPFEVLQRHAAVVGPTGSGKTKSVLVPWIVAALRQGHSVVAVDIAGDLLDDLQVHQLATGRLDSLVAKWDYTDPAGSISWNWLASLNDDEALSAAVEALNGRQAPNDSQPYFHQRDARLLRGLLELARAVRPTATGKDLLDLLLDQSLLEGLVRANRHHPAARRLSDIVARPVDEYLTAVSGVINALEAWNHPGLEAITSRVELDLDTLFHRTSLLVVGAPLQGGKTAEAASGLLLSQLINRLYRRFASRAGKHVFLVIDEAARLTGRLPMEELLSVGRRARVSVVLATQDVGQFRDKDERAAILGNCATYLTLPGASKANAEYFASRLGQRTQATTSLTHSPGASSGQLSLGSQLTQVDVLGAREILDPPWGERTALVHCQAVSGKPFLVDLTRPEFACEA